MKKLLTEFTPGRGYTKEDWDEVSDHQDSAPEELADFRPFAEVFPEIAANIAKRRGPAKTKDAISIRLDQDLVARLRASGPGWQSRLNAAVRRWLDDAA